MTDRPRSLDAIAQITRATTRGLELERFVADLFRRYHFKVTPNAGTARPRQTDIFASKVNEVYLVECKWRKDNANINDVDSVRARLGRTDRHVVGLLVSMSGFSGSVISDVQMHRGQPIVLMSGDELAHVTGGHASLSDLLWRKKEALTADGQVLLDEPSRRSPSRRRTVRLPASDQQFARPDGSRGSVIDCGGSFSRFLFSHSLPDIDWLPASGHGVTLDVTPDVRDEREVLELLSQLAGLGWTTSDARWSIQQSTMNWHGLGGDVFAQELPRWRRRAEVPAAHHSEEFCYLDRCDGGFYTLTASLAAHSSRRASFVGLSFQLQGIPLDVGPMLQLCRSVGVHDGVYFRPRAEQSVKHHHGSPRLVDGVRPIAYLTSVEDEIDDSTEWVTGIIVNNPFRDADPGTPRWSGPEGLQILQESELLVCSLAHHHPLDDKPYAYYLRNIELATTSDVAVCRPVADWDQTSDPAVP